MEIFGWKKMCLRRKGCMVAIHNMLEDLSLPFPTYSQFFFAVVLRPNACHGLLILEVSRSHTTMHHSR